LIILENEKIIVKGWTNKLIMDIKYFMEQKKGGRINKYD
jgi:hypothetical protein